MTKLDRIRRLHPEPVPDLIGGNIYVYLDAAIHPDMHAWFEARYIAYNGPYPQGERLAAAYTLTRVIAKARLAAVRNAENNRPVNVTAYTRNSQP